MATRRIVTETEEQRQVRLFKEVYNQVEIDITKKHIVKQRAPIIVQLKSFFEPVSFNCIFFYDHESKADLKMLVPRLYTEEEWDYLMNDLITQGILTEAYICPSVPVAFAKFTKLIDFNSDDPLKSNYEYVIGFYAQEELDKLTATIENYEIINYAKKAQYQNELLRLKDSNNIKQLRDLQSRINY